MTKNSPHDLYADDFRFSKRNFFITSSILIIYHFGEVIIEDQIIVWGTNIKILHTWVIYCFLWMATVYFFFKTWSASKNLLKGTEIEQKETSNKANIAYEIAKKKLQRKFGHIFNHDVRYKKNQIVPFTNDGQDWDNLETIFHGCPVTFDESVDQYKKTEPLEFNYFEKILIHCKSTSALTTNCPEFNDMFAVWFFIFLTIFSTIFFII